MDQAVVSHEHGGKQKGKLALFRESLLGELVEYLLPVLCTMAAAVGGYYEARQARLEAHAAHQQSRRNWECLRRIDPDAAEAAGAAGAKQRSEP